MRERHRPKTQTGDVAEAGNEAGVEAGAGAPAASTNVDMLRETGEAAYAAGQGNGETARGYGV